VFSSSLLNLQLLQQHFVVVAEVSAVPPAVAIVKRRSRHIGVVIAARKVVFIVINFRND